ncbi:MAG: DUF362 domain-containing protein, partial [Dehalococcoidia bacterium]|nr:DUF362 domain-containing protein [Dehalococcoidia bacterium]
MSELSRRSFLNQTALMGAALALGRWLPSSRHRGQITPTAAVFPANRVIHAHCNAATYWDYTTGWYGDYVDQAIVDEMTDQGVMALTDTATPAGAWRALIPTYAAGQVVAIKINLNNASSEDSDQIIDALPQPVNSVIRGLRSIGAEERDIRVYDVTDGMHLSAMPGRLVRKISAPYPEVQFHSNTSDHSIVLGYSSTEMVHFNVPPGGPSIDDLPICNALVDATYLINMPVMKKHSGAGVTLGFKNHFGSIQHNNLLHWATLPIDPQYNPGYSGLVDIFSNPHFVGKTVLTIGDGLYGARFNQYGEVPSPWPTFGDMSPNSLFFSVDPVAIDCVMLDILEEEGGVIPGSDDYLRIADEHGLGSYGRRDTMNQY